MKRKLVIVNRDQFGYHTDTFKYCQHLTNYRITYYCVDQKLPKVDLSNVDVVYVPLLFNIKIASLLLILKVIVKEVYSDSFMFIVYFPYCHILRIFIKRNNVNVDVRTLSVSPDSLIRSDFNNKVLNSIKSFPNISVISKGVANELKLADYSLLPLGSDSLCTKEKSYETIELLYVGTFFNRRIDDTLTGLRIFLDNAENPVKIHYHIIGFGEGEDLIKEKILTLKLEDNVTFYGRKKYEELPTYFEKCNIGVSYIPITDYYDNQPPTKTFEFICSGLFCIATNTSANKEVINKNNGILIEDNPESFANAIDYIVKKRGTFDSSSIRESAKDYTWADVVKNYLLKIISNEDTEVIYKYS